MAGFTNKGKYRIAGAVFRAETLPTSFYVALCTSATAPTADTNTFSQLTEITAGAGYVTGGTALSKNSTDFDLWSEDDSADLGKVQIRDVTWTASGDTIPSAGDGARYAVLTDANATVGDREVWIYWDLSSDRVVSDGQDLSLADLEFRFQES